MIDVTVKPWYMTGFFAVGCVRAFGLQGFPAYKPTSVAFLPCFWKRILEQAILICVIISGKIKLASACRIAEGLARPFF